jgi:hypothetical protein
MIGITTYRDYFAMNNRNGSSKYESLCQYVLDIAEALGEEAEIVPSTVIRQDEEDFSKYSQIVLFEHPASFVGTNGQAGFTTPNVETHYIQFKKVTEYKGKLLSCNLEWQKPEIWTPRIGARRHHPVTGQWAWPTDEQIYSMFDRGLRNSLSEKFKQTRLNRSAYSVGDSHTLMVWRPGSTAEAIPARTLFRTLREGIDRVIPPTAKDLTLCFGNIDLRHHFNRQPDPTTTAEEMAKEYVRQASELDLEDVKICELLPIITPDRRVSKAYYYKKEPHAGTTEERMALREKFNGALRRYGKKTKNVSILRHPDAFFGPDGLLAEKAVERTNGGIHLATHFYEWSASRNYQQPELAWQP